MSKATSCEQTPSMETSSAPNPSSKPATAYSCLRCFNRRVKCDRRQPCGACAKHNAECVFRVPPPPRPRKKRVQEEILVNRLKRYELLLRQSGVDSRSLPGDLQVRQLDELHRQREPATMDTSQLQTPSSTSGSERAFTESKLLYNQGRAKFIDNNVWTSVAEEFHDPGDALEIASDEDDDQREIAEDSADFVLGLTPTPRNIGNLHPSIEHIFDLWQIFLENVDPLTKVVHSPTLQASIHRATTDLDRVSKSLEALMFAIYSLAVLSLKDHECQRKFGESREVLLARYRPATKAALSRTRFMGTANIVVLQAFYLHLLSMREVYDGGTSWTLAGVAGRIAEGIGLHRDGTYLGLPPFETEMRRRLWWRLKMLNLDTADLSGTGKMRNIDMDSNSTKLPSNVNDDEIYPGMATFPAESAKPTEVIVCSLKAELVNFWTNYAINKRLRNGRDSGLFDNYESKNDIGEMDKAIDELEQVLETKYVRYCDASQPEQLLTLILARMAIKKMHLAAHHPRRWRSEEDIPEPERQYVWNLSIGLLEATIMALTSRQLQRFLWHTTFYVPWEALIHILDCLRTHPLTPEGVKAWQIIDELYECHPAFHRKSGHPLYVAAGNLCLRAYNAREAAFAEQGKSMSWTPGYITELRQQREAAKARRVGQKQAHRQSNILDASFPSLAQLAINGQIIPSCRKQPRPEHRSTIADTPNKASPGTQHFEQPAVSQHAGLIQGQMATDSGASWYDTDIDERPLRFPFPTFAGDMIDMDFDSTLAQGSNIEDPGGQAIDWTQWDALLSGGVNAI